MEGKIMNSSENYSDKGFWNERFEKSRGSFDWYVGWPELKPYLTQYLTKESEILMVGCGNSKLSEMMYKEEYNNIVNIDISDIVIEQMNSTCNENFPKMKFLEMDATSMSFPDDTFNFVFDKGTLDALMCSKDPEIPYGLIREMFRVTKTDSHFAVVTYGKPEERLKIFLEALKENKFEYEVKKVSLSLMSNLINILRNKSSDFSVKSAIKDTKVLVTSVVEACITKLKEEKEKLNESEVELTEEEKKSKVDILNKKIMSMKLMKLIYEKKAEREKREKKEICQIEEKEDIEIKKNIDDETKEKIESEDANQNKEFIQNENIIEENENLKGEENNSNSETVSEYLYGNNINIKDTNGARRSHCYLYLIKKMSK